MLRVFLIWAFGIGLVFATAPKPSSAAPARCPSGGPETTAADVRAPAIPLVEASNARDALSSRPTLLIYALGAPDAMTALHLAIEFGRCGVIAIPISASQVVSAGDLPAPIEHAATAAKPGVGAADGVPTESIYPSTLLQALNRSTNLCAANALVFAYLVEAVQRERTLLGSTRTRVKVLGYLYDCNRRILGTYEGEDNQKELTNPGLALFKYIGIAVALNSRIQSAALTTSAPLISSFFDRTSNEQNLVSDGTQRAFLHLVRDDFCVRVRGACQTDFSQAR